MKKRCPLPALAWFLAVPCLPAETLSSGPVHDPKGNRVGTFNSVWRRGGDGTWKVILDKGCPPCDCPPAGGPAGSPGGGR